MRRDDDDLRVRFRQLRAEDGAHMPPFRAMLSRAGARVRSGRGLHTAGILGMAAAAGVIVASGVALARSGSGDADRIGAYPGHADESAAPSISNWKSPTASLVRTSGRHLLAPPSILTSVLDGVVPTPGQPDGDSP